MAQQNWSAGGGPGVYSQGNLPQLDDVNFLSLSGDLDDLFQVCIAKLLQVIY